MKVSHIVAEFVTSFPDQLEPGRLYVSTQFASASHLCACGCGREVITPLSPAQWVLTFDGTISVKPSIGNWAFPCQSHYVIDHGNIRWARGFTRDEIHRNRESDGRILAATHPPHLSWWDRLLGRHKDK
ncbi:DUF6527 family protein [Aeromicrobium sp.]|uniref:DUF6527 family protein n=1 Tax=Aeromicrobium sp. TaxID=1871063 RepID=UPI002FCCB3C3